MTISEGTISTLTDAFPGGGGEPAGAVGACAPANTGTQSNATIESNRKRQRRGFMVIFSPNIAVLVFRQQPRQ
jgi:hypothetical protein